MVFRSMVDSLVVLQPLRARSGLTISSIAVNGARVDVVAGDGVDEWRVVFFSATSSADGPASIDPATIESVRIFRRPTPMPVVAGGRAVIVNGPSSAGKSTLLRELARDGDTPWVTFDEPIFGTVDVEYLIWRDRAEVLHRGFLHGIAALARAGNSVAVAAGGHPQHWFDEAFGDIPVVRVGLSCALDELERRERTRRDVPGGWAAASLDVHDDWDYDLTFDTGTVSIGEIADQVLAAALQPSLYEPSPGRTKPAS